MVLRETKFLITVFLCMFTFFTISYTSFNHSTILSYEVTDQNSEGVFSSLSRSFDETLDEINNNDNDATVEEQGSSSNTANANEGEQGSSSNTANANEGEQGSSSNTANSDSLENFNKTSSAQNSNPQNTNLNSSASIESIELE